MPLRLGPRGTSTCCDCSQFTGCDCGDLEVPLQCRTKGGEAELCGFPEYTSPSVPPKKYRTLTPSGEFYLCYYQFPNCTGIQSPTESYDFNDAPPIVFSTTTCSRNNPLYTRYIKTGNPAGCSYEEAGTALTDGLVPDGTEGDAEEAFTGGTRNRTPTTFTEAYDGVTCLPGGTGNGLVRHGSYTLTLSDEDTEIDAIGRLLAGAEWTDWTLVGTGMGGTCTNPACCLAKYEERIAGFTFDYQAAEFRVRRDGLPPGESFIAEVDIYRRIAGSSDSWVLFQTLEVSGTVDGFGLFEVEQPVPNEQGFESYAASPARLRVA